MGVAIQSLPADAVVACYCYAGGLAGVAHAEPEGAVGADAVEVDGDVAERHHGAEVAEGLTGEDGDGGRGLK